MFINYLLQNIIDNINEMENEIIEQDNKKIGYNIDKAKEVEKNIILRNS